MAEITTRGLTKEYDRNVLAVDEVDLDVADGELLVLVGPSGCGKSTLLRMVAGLEEVTAGSITIGARDVTYLPPKKRDIAMVFQSYALYPHMTVRKNIGYPLRLAKVPATELDRRVTEVAGLLHLDEVLDRRPSQLSGGQRQRVAMGRALVREPQAFLMDEPLSNLDAKLRVEMRAEIARLQRDLAVTTLYVTHDQVEAMTMGTRVAVLNHGRLQQVDTPQRIYDAPVNLFVATFIGSPAMNLFAGQLQVDGEAVTVRLGTQRLPLDPAVLASHPGLVGRDGDRVVVGIRPEAFDDAALDPGVPGDRVVEATVDLVESLGAELVVHVGLNGATTTDRVDRPRRGRSPASLPATESPRDADPTTGPTPDVSAGPTTWVDDAEPSAGSNGAAVTPWQEVVARRGRAVARLSTRSRVCPGDIVKLAVDPTGVHLFDAETGESLRRPLPDS